MDRYKAAILLENLIARIAHDPTTNQHTLPGVLSSNEVSALRAALVALGESIDHAQPPSIATSPPNDGYLAASAAAPPAPNPEAPAAAALPATVPGRAQISLGPNPPPAVASAISSEFLAAGPVAVEAEPAKPAPAVNARPIARDPVRVVREFAAARSASVAQPGVILCLDFGTARSKAFATVPAGNGASGHVELGLGKLAGERDAVYAVSSSVWIEDDGLVFVGPSAVSRSQRPGTEQKRFDSLKQELSQGDMSHPPDKVKVPADVNPSDVPLTCGHLLTFYLAYLTDLAETALQQHAKGLTRHVARRFALPSWEDARLNWGESLLRHYLARAQIVGDVFRGRWPDGIPAAEVKAVIDATANLSDDDLPLHLILEGVLEPVAAGASRLRADGQRGLVMVIDVGAGTTDFALFVTTENKMTDGVRAFQIQGGVRTLRQAGDTVDSLLRKMMLDRMGVRSEDPDFKRVNAERLRTIREDKETLFKRGLVRFNDGADTITLKEFVESDGARRFAGSLKNKFDEILVGIDPSFITGLADGGLKVVLTGGGATLPMVEELAHGTMHVRGQMMLRSQAPLVPEAFQGSAFAAEYPELAVAIGGASDDMPTLRTPLKEWLGSRTSNVVAGKLQISGTQRSRYCARPPFALERIEERNEGRSGDVRKTPRRGSPLAS